jgi:hypothetical protein
VKFKIGQTVRLRSSAQAGQHMAGAEYRIVRQLPRPDRVVCYRVRNSADDHDEVVVKESELQGWKGF